jgi:hypothetical protein
MSYEHCDKHDCDATNGCPACEQAPPTHENQTRITIELTLETVTYLQVLVGAFGAADLEGVIEHLAHSAAAGIRRPGAWERGWLTQAFGDEWENKCERVPGTEYAQLRPMLRVESSELRRPASARPASARRKRV